MTAQRLALLSWSAFSPPLLATLERLHREHGLETIAVGPARARVDPVYAVSGFVEAARPQAGLDVRVLPLIDPERPEQGFERAALAEALHTVQADAIWIAEEPSSATVRQTLRHLYRRRGPRIGCWVVENLWRRPPFVQRLKSRLLYRRLDAVLACASLSLESVRAAFVPRSVPGQVLFLPNLDPTDLRPDGFTVPRGSGDFWLAFVGRISQEKGWPDLLAAMATLPTRVRLMVAGDGPDRELLLETAAARGLGKRVLVPGTLSRDAISALYRQVDAVVVPSRTTSTWKEQFGRVIAESMGAGAPVVASESGAIPEVVGDAGLLVREQDPAALAAALSHLIDSPETAQRLRSLGRKRFETEFSVHAYASRLAGALGLHSPGPSA